MTSRAIHSVIFSPGSAAGHEPFASQVGQMTLKFGPGPAPASPSAPREKGEGSQTPVTFGLHGSISFASSALKQFLGNKLRQKTALNGSTLFRLIWKERVTPSGRRISALRASALLTLDKGYGSSGFRFPTPTAPVKTNGHQAGNNRFVTKVQAMIGGKINPSLAGWLMGYPEEWISCAPSVTRSSRRSLPSS